MVAGQVGEVGLERATVVDATVAFAVCVVPIVRDQCFHQSNNQSLSLPSVPEVSYSLDANQPVLVVDTRVRYDRMVGEMVENECACDEMEIDRENARRTRMMSNDGDSLSMTPSSAECVSLGAWLAVVISFARDAHGRLRHCSLPPIEGDSLTNEWRQPMMDERVRDRVSVMVVDHQSSHR